MKGHIRQRSHGKYEFSIPLGYDKEGKNKRFTRGGFDTHADAEAAYIKAMYELQIGKSTSPTTDLTVGEFLANWLDQKKHGLASGSYKSYRTYIDNYLEPHLGHIPLTELSPRHITGMYSKLNLSARTIRSTHKLLSQAMQKAIQFKLLSENPCQWVDLPRIRKTKIDLWTAEQLARFLQVAKTSRWYTAFLIGAHTGARLGEVLALQWKDVDLDKGEIFIYKSVATAETGCAIGNTKTESSIRRVSLPKSVVDELQALKQQPSDYIAHTQTGHFVNPRNLYKEFQNIIAFAGLPPMRYHDLRHLHTTMLLESGANLKAISKRLGHANTSTTINTYSHFLPSMDEQLTAKLETLIPAT